MWGSLVILIVGGLLASCGSAPTAPSQSYAGEWLGNFVVQDSTRVSGDAPSPCRFFIGGEFPLRLTLQQSGNRVTGNLRLWQNPESGSVSGEVKSSGELTLAGTLRGEAADTISQVQNWVTTVVSVGMTGTFTLDERFTNTFGAQRLQFRCELKSVQRTASQ
jgi:hypothetical protein